VEIEQYAIMARAEEDHWWYRGMRRITDAFLNRVFRGRTDLEILDAGCGTGINCRHFASRGRAVGLDFSAEALTFARGRQVPWLVRGSVDALPFADGRFDLVTSFDVLYHLDVRSEGDAMREFARVMKPGGYVLVRLPAYDWLRSAHDRAVHTRHRFTRGELRSMFREAGLEVRSLSYANSSLFPVAAGARLAERFMKPSATAEPLDHPPSRPVNAALATLLSLEGAVATWPGLPFGLSVVGLARRV
jgi:SAM-dependent methyltransferase